MKYLDLTLSTPAANLACDEALLDACDAGGEAVLRFWEPPVYHVVLGYANRVEESIDRQACADRGISWYRRCSGGGAVLVGPGCLNYAVALPIIATPACASIPGANRYVLERVAAALARFLPEPLALLGHTDLVMGRRKVSGNSQRRKRSSVLVHGTLLYELDFELVQACLRLPHLQPEYRAGRSHTAFLANLPLSVSQMKAALREAWQAVEPARAPEATIERLVVERYGQRSWHDRF